MAQTINQLQRKIMRRIYYAFCLKIATHPIMLHATLLAVSVYLLSYFISFTSILHNMQSVKVGDLGRYVLNAFMHAQFWTLVLIGVIFFTTISLRFSLRTIHFRSPQTI